MGSTLTQGAIFRNITSDIFAHVIVLLSSAAEAGIWKGIIERRWYDVRICMKERERKKKQLSVP